MTDEWLMNCYRRLSCRRIDSVIPRCLVAAAVVITRVCGIAAVKAFNPTSAKRWWIITNKSTAIVAVTTHLVMRFHESALMFGVWICRPIRTDFRACPGLSTPSITSRSSSLHVVLLREPCNPILIVTITVFMGIIAFNSSFTVLRISC